jgi:predicted DNA-binding transcriptional regulator YafY
MVIWIANSSPSVSNLLVFGEDPEMTSVDMRALNQAMSAPDDLVVALRYTDKKGVTTERVVSPIRWLQGKALLALCLCRETPRRFDLERCSDVRLMNANDILMPVPIRVVA